MSHLLTPPTWSYCNPCIWYSLHVYFRFCSVNTTLRYGKDRPRRHNNDNAKDNIMTMHGETDSQTDMAHNMIVTTFNGPETANEAWGLYTSLSIPRLITKSAFVSIAWISTSQRRQWRHAVSAKCNKMQRGVHVYSLKRTYYEWHVISYGISCESNYHPHIIIIIIAIHSIMFIHRRYGLEFSAQQS